MAWQSRKNYPYSQQPGAGQNHGERNSNPQGGPIMDVNTERGFHEDSFLAFSDKSVRMAFIRKVYSILTVQLTLTALIGVLLFSNKELKTYISTNPILLLVAIVVCFSMLCVLSCCATLARTTPINYMLLFVFTIAEGFLIAAVCVRYQPETVLLALGITILICFSITVFAFQTTIDFTGLGMVLCIILVIFFAVGIVFTFFQPTKPVQLLFAAMGVLIFAFYLIYDTQMMMAGKHKYAFSPEDYVFAALSLYLDILNIFMFVLQILSVSGSD